MTTPQELKATERDTTLTPRQLRAAGYVPATLYAKGGESRQIQVRTHEFIQFCAQGTRQFKLTGFVNELVTIKEIQMESVSRQPLSIQFSPDNGKNITKSSKKKSA